METMAVGREWGGRLRVQRRVVTLGSRVSVGTSICIVALPGYQALPCTVFLDLVHDGQNA